MLTLSEAVSSSRLFKIGRACSVAQLLHLALHPNNGFPCGVLCVPGSSERWGAAPEAASSSVAEPRGFLCSPLQIEPQQEVRSRWHNHLRGAVQVSRGAVGKRD